MKKRIACPECNGNGRITLARMYNDYCGIGCKQCDYCGGNGFLEVPMTNADRIRAMSDEELAAYLSILSEYSCCFNPINISCSACPWDEFCSIGKEDVLPWLQQPAKEG
jgi:hypothetical protein